MSSSSKGGVGEGVEPVRVAVCHEHIHDWDAVGRDVVGMAKILVELGIKVTIIGRSFEGSARAVAEVLLPPADFNLNSFDILIYHHSTHWEAGERLLREFNGPSLIKYHNVTPPSFFARYSECLADTCEAGIKQTSVLADICPAAYWAADSCFNSKELCDLGIDVSRLEVAPPFHNAEFVPRELGVTLSRDRALLRLLFVGRVAPNKGHANMLRILAKYMQSFGAEIRFDIVGEAHPEMIGYLRCMQELSVQLGIASLVHWHGGLPDEEIADLYRRADIFLCMSEHEGFCVPLIEAQALGLPVVAGKAGAVAETLGEEQLVTDLPHRELDYLFYANLLRELWQNPHLRRRVAEQGYRNYWQRFSPERVADSFVEAILPVLREVVK